MNKLCFYGGWEELSLCKMCHSYCIYYQDGDGAVSWEGCIYGKKRQEVFCKQFLGIERRGEEGFCEQDISIIDKGY
jgi:hypothetical protein